MANKLQRFIISINLVKLLQLKNNPDNIKDQEQLRLVIQGTAGVGKTFVVTALTYIVRRLFGYNSSVMNLAPTGAAAVLLPDGQTVHSVTNIPRRKKELQTAQMSDYPMSDKQLSNLRNLTGTYCLEDQPLQLMCLNMDERGMFSHRLLAWCSQRFSEATGVRDSPFGGIPVVNFFGDLGQMSPVDARDLHKTPCAANTEDTAGYTIYNSFTDCVVLDQTMRQGPDQLAFLELLLRIRKGAITQQDWLDINGRFEAELPLEEQQLFKSAEVITLMETWAEVIEHNMQQLANLEVPVAVIPSVGNGRHHSKIDKQCGQIIHRAMMAVGSKVMLTKNQQGLTSLGLNNGAVGTVVSILYAEDVAPPSFPIAVVVDFKRYKGPTWITDQPTWVPIPVNEARCESQCCTRRGIPLMPAYAITIAKSQGMSIGLGEPFEKARIKFQASTIMEQLNCGTTYTALSRQKKETDFALFEKLPFDRLSYINTHPHMPDRLKEDERLKVLHEEALKKYSHLTEDAEYIRLLQQLDSSSNDGIHDGVCLTDDEECACIICRC